MTPGRTVRAQSWRLAPTASHATPSISAWGRGARASPFPLRGTAWARVAGRRIIVRSFARNDRHDREAAMKYVLLGNLSPQWASKQSERIGKGKAKLDRLGIKIESIHYTQGDYDFVDIVHVPNPEAMLAFSVWYSIQGLGRIQSMPAFDAKSFEAAIKDAAD